MPSSGTNSPSRHRERFDAAAARSDSGSPPRSVASNVSSDFWWITDEAFERNHPPIEVDKVFDAMVRQGP